MKDFYSDYTKDKDWLIKELEPARSMQNTRESQFALGNGYLGARGIYEEMPTMVVPGTYIAGVYDKMGSLIDTMVNLPNPFKFKLAIEGEKLNLISSDTSSHKRVLNTKKAVLVRHTTYTDIKKRRYDYQSLRFLSAHNKNIGVMQTYLTALDEDCFINVSAGIDNSVFNEGTFSEGNKRHFLIKEMKRTHNADYLIIDTLEKKHTIVYWSGFYYVINGKKIFARDNNFRLKIKKGETVVFTKVFCIKHFPYKKNHNNYKKEAYKFFYKAFKSNFYGLIKSHIKEWEKLWLNADILIDGPENIQENLRFNIYHLLTCLNYDDGFSSIGARTLSGDGYRGHIFWDAEIFLLPFYLFNFPETAKNMLLYRYKRLERARKLAKKEGFKGAKFPWESASTGNEETPEFVKDNSGEIVQIATHKQEHHINADIAYAVYKYYIATGDKVFMENYGYEMFFEIARFWASRVKYNKTKNIYEINSVMGPDEFHLNVDNSAYTNFLARWNLETACDLFNEVKKNLVLSEKFKKEIKLQESEAKKWKNIASKININIDKNNVIEEFDGYFKLKKVSTTKKIKDFNKTQLIKQADVLMLFYLFGDAFNFKIKNANYNFYKPKTLHNSSLSLPVHSVVASGIKKEEDAYNFFINSLCADISNVYKNTREGLHAASLGAVWQAVVFGFCGIKIGKEKLSINPRLPKLLKKIAFSLFWKGNLIKFEVSNNTIKVIATKKKPVKIEVFDKLVSFNSNKAYSFNRK